jgi:hypothetical protein
MANVFGSLMEAFRNSPSAPTPANNPNNMSVPGNIPANGPNNDPLAFNNPQATPAPTAAPAPMADFAKLWEPKAVDPNAPGPIKFNIDPAEVQKAAQSLDFTKAVTPQLMETIGKGGADAQAAMMTAMNAMLQSAVSQMSIANASTTERALAMQYDNTIKGIPDLVRQQSAKDLMMTDNPLASNPATKPLFDQISSQFATSFPGATPAEINAKAREYMVNMGKEISKLDPNYKAPDAVGAIPKGQPDWGIFLDPNLAQNRL